MPDPLTIRDAWTSMRDHIGAMPPDMDPDDHAIGADVFTSLSYAMADHYPDPDAEMTRADLPPNLAGDDPSTWFVAITPTSPLPPTLIRWIHANVPTPSWVPRDLPDVQ